MKRRFSKILGVGLTLALLFSLLLTAAPVSALSSATVTVDPATISAVDAEYAIRFELDEQLTAADSAVTSGAGAYDLFAIGDSFVITATTAADTATITEATATAVTVALSGGATLVSYTGGPTGGVHTINFNAINATATVTGATADTSSDCSGTWALTGSPGALVTARDDDTITIVFDTDTAVVVGPTATLLAGPGWINGVWNDATIGTLASVVGTVDTSTVVVTLPTGTRIGEGAEVRLAFTAGITNPDADGTYNLTVATSKETTAVPSADYAITVPDIGVLPGIVQQYNAADPMVLMDQDTGDDAINTMVDSAGVDYTIVVGPGEYAIAATIDLDQAGLTFKSSAGADDTIIDASALTGSGILVNAADVTVDGFTIEDAGATGIYVNATAVDAIVQNNVVTFDEYYGIGIDIHASATGVTVSGNEIGDWGTMFVHGTDATLSGNTFGECVNISGTVAGLTITDNIMTASAAEAIDFISGTFTDVLIEGNTISEAALNAIVIRGTIANLQILDNEITDNEGVGILIDGAVATTNSAIAIKLNTITGNDADNDGYGIQNEATDAADIVDATFNWWGTTVADDIAAMVNDTATSGSVTAYEPFLADTADAVFSASDVAVGVTSIAKDTADVAVSVTDSTGTAEVADVISVAKYIANPEEAIADAIAFFDVYVVGTGAPTTDLVTIKFYAGDAQTDVYLWSAATLTWGDPLDATFSSYGGYVYVTVEADMLDGTPFALVAGAAAEIDAPVIVAPDPGERDVPLTPMFTWTQIALADAYYFEFADNANFVVPMVSLTGDLGRLIVTAYAYVGELDYSSPYYWRVKAVSGTIEAGDLGESVWATGVFITIDEPVEPTPPIVVEEVQPPVIVVEQPDIIVPLPAETAITPAWIYVIIGVGAVLVIALLVLIVRTRRVA